MSNLVESGPYQMIEYPDSKGSSIVFPGYPVARVTHWKIGEHEGYTGSTFGNLLRETAADYGDKFDIVSGYDSFDNLTPSSVIVRRGDRVNIEVPVGYSLRRVQGTPELVRKVIDSTVEGVGQLRRSIGRLPPVYVIR